MKTDRERIREFRDRLSAAVDRAHEARFEPEANPTFESELRRTQAALNITNDEACRVIFDMNRLLLEDVHDPLMEPAIDRGPRIEHWKVKP